MIRRPATPILAAALLLMVDVAIAATGEGHGDQAHHSEAAWMTLLFSAVNFGIFVFLLTKYAWPALKDFLVKRRREVAEAMAAAERAREEAEAIRREFSEKEAALEETRRRMLDEIRQGAAADRERALREAAETAERLRTEAARQAEHDLARARRELRAEAARLAAEIAEKDVRSRLTDADRSRLVREFVEGVAKQ